jgi:hypothetical protein
LTPVSHTSVYGVMTEAQTKAVPIWRSALEARHNQRIQLNDGYLFRCRLCGEDHEVPENVAPYSTSTHMFFNVHIGSIELGCSTKPGTERYSFADFAPCKVTSPKNGSWPLLPG